MLTKLNNFPEEVQLYYKKLKPKQRRAAEAMVDPDDVRSVKALCQDLEISRTAFYNWQHQPEFAGYVKALIDSLTSSIVPKAWKQIARKIDDGNMEAIKTLFEIKGELSSGNAQTQNVVVFTGEDIQP